MLQNACMEPFLRRTARVLYNTCGENLSRVCLVFPGRRAGLFFNRELSGMLTRDIWMPHSCSIGQLVERVTGSKASDDLSLLASLYSVYTKITSKDVSFSDFYALGTILLRDFDLIDKYLADPVQLYNNIRDLKHIEQDYSFLSTEQIECIRSFWKAFEVNPDHNLNKQFVSLWEKLPVIYRTFNKELLDKDQAYEGALYRRMAEKLKQEGPLPLFEGYPLYAFIGFNALNACEKVMFNALKEAGKAVFFWDYDAYYIENQIQEAGLFMRENIRNFPPAEPYDKTFSPLNEPSTIEVLPVPSYVMQAKIVPQVLKRHNLPKDIRSAIVLADEELLVPLLYSLAPAPDSASGTLNVTMGFPLKRTSAFTLIDILVRYGCSGKGYTDARPLRMHPYIQTLNIEKELSVKPASIKELHELLTFLLDKLDDSEDLRRTDKMLVPIVRETRKQLNRIYLSVGQAGMDMSLKLYAQLLLTHLATVSIPFSGEPLEGLQIMGFLETRCLDFENLVILSAQENVLPGDQRDHSLIPYNIKKAFGLPSPEQHMAMHAYYFYRLIQRARHITFIYNNKTEGSSKGEVSRFVRQIACELSSAEFIRSGLTYSLSLPAIQPVSVPKTGSVMEKLLQFTSQENRKSISPSALQTYIKCTLRFYYEYVARLRSPDETTEEMDSLHFGNIVHSVLEQIYKPYLNKMLDKAQLMSILGNKAALKNLIDRTAEDYLDKTFGEDSAMLKGRWSLLSEVATLYVENFIRFDANQAPFMVKNVEMRFTAGFSNVTIGGIIDRLDLRNGNLYLIDYKTGAEKNVFTSVEELFSGKPALKNDNVFQVLCYSFLYAGRNPGTGTPVPLLYYLRTLSTAGNNGFLSYGRSILNEPAMVEALKNDFYDRLKVLLEELFNFSIPFVQTEYSDHCKYCSFISICQRDKKDE